MSEQSEVVSELTQVRTEGNVTPTETVAFIRDYADRQEAFASPTYTQHTEFDRRAYLYAARVLRRVADQIEQKYDGGTS